MKRSIAFIIFTILAGAGTVKAQNQSPDTTARYFLIQASIGNLQEIASGKLAQQRATSPDVKAFAEMMVMDHSKVQEQILEVAKESNIQLPIEATETPVPDRTLKIASDKDFDRLYVHIMVPGHRETIGLFENYAITGKNPIVKAFAKQTLPTFKKHLSEITTIDNNMKDQSAK